MPNTGVSRGEAGTEARVVERFPIVPVERTACGCCSVHGEESKYGAARGRKITECCLGQSN